jgi:hypothetical protein
VGHYSSTGFPAGPTFLLSLGPKDVVSLTFVLSVRFLDSTVRAKRGGEVLPIAATVARFDRHRGVILQLSLLRLVRKVILTLSCVCR